MKKITIWLVLLMFGVLISPNYSFALGQMTEPIVISNALRGESIQQELIAVNSDKTELKVNFSAEGPIKDWTKFYLPDDLDTSLDSFTLPANGNLRIVSIIDVPDDIENGEYVGSFGVSNMPDTDLKEDESGSSVTQRIDRKITIIVSDQEDVNIEKTSVIPNKFDLVRDEALSIRVIYDNQGNIRLKPQVRIKIKKDDKNVHDIIYPYPEDDSAVNSKSQYEIEPIVIQTIGWETGKYFAFLEFSRGDTVLLEKDFKFYIAEAGESPETEREAGFTRNNYIVIALFFGLLLFIIIWQFFRKSKK